MKTTTRRRHAWFAWLAWLPAPAFAAGLLNGSFESGLDGWEHAGNVTVQSAAPYAPTDGASLVAFNAMNLTPNGWIRQHSAVKPGRPHELAFDAGNLGYTKAYQRMRIEVSEETSSGTSYLINQVVEIPGTTGGATVWAALKSVGFTPTTDNVTVVFRDVSTVTGGLDLVLDKVSLYQQITYTEVTTDIDENDGALGLGQGNSLREMLAHAATHPEVDEIRFHSAIPEYRIELVHGELQVTTPITINATGSSRKVVIDAGGRSRVMWIYCAGDAGLDGLTLRGGAVAGDGGGLLVNAGPEGASPPSVTLQNCVLEENRCGGSGGGLYGSTGLINLVRTRILNNRAAGNGGGLHVGILGIVGLDQCDISDNRACGNGGGICALLSKVTLANSTLASNRAGGTGGAIHSHSAGPPYKSGYLLTSNSTITANQSFEAGPAVYTYGVCSFTHCTIIGNAGSDSGAIHTDYGTVHLHNSIVSAHPGTGPAVTGDFPIEEGNNWLSGDPMLAPLADYGGSTPTMPPMPGSPVIEAAAAEPEFPPTDQRGAPRPSGPLPDIGAVEAVPISSIQPTADEDNDSIDDRIEPFYGFVVGEDNSACDSDCDGWTDAQEIANMTDPRDPQSRLHIRCILPTDAFDPVTNPEFEIRFPSFPGLRYSVECDQALDFSPATRREWSLGESVAHETSVRLMLAPQRDFVRVRRDP